LLIDLRSGIIPKKKAPKQKDIVKLKTRNFTRNLASPISFIKKSTRTPGINSQFYKTGTSKKLNFDISEDGDSFSSHESYQVEQRMPERKVAYKR
jgi:hypothetical protein